MLLLFRKRQCSECLVSSKVVLHKNVQVSSGDSWQDVYGGVLGIIPAHASEVGVCLQDGVSVCKIKGEDVFCPRYSVEEAAYEKFSSAAAVGQIFMEHQKVVSEVKVGFSGILCRQRPASEVVYSGRWHGGDGVACKMYSPA